MDQKAGLTGTILWVEGVVIEEISREKYLNGIHPVVPNLMTCFSLICYDYYSCAIIINYYKVAQINLQVKTEVQQVCYVLHSKFEHELQCCVFRLVATD